VAVETEKIVEQQRQKERNGHLRSVALRAYEHHQKTTLDEERIVRFLPMVHKIAQRAVTYLRPPLSLEDLISAGAVGLIKAARDFDPSHNAEFETYAYIRVKGAILDELRGFSLLSSNMSRQIQNVATAGRELVEQTGVPPTDAELADRLGITIEKLFKTFEGARAQHFVSLDGSGDDMPALAGVLASKHTARPDERLEKKEILDKLAQAIRQLPDKQRQVVLLYYYSQLTMKQIAEVSEITESRVSQLHAAAVFNLSIKLRQWKDGR